MKNNTDPRFQKTDQKIQKAFHQLLEKHTFQKITVKMILENTGINRSTFYAHYLDKYDLLEQCEQSLLNGFTAHITETVDFSSLNNSNLSDYLNQYLEEALFYIKEHRPMFLLYLGIAEVDFWKSMDPVSLDMIRNLAIFDRYQIPANYMTAALTGAIRNIIKEWLANGCTETIPQMQSYLVTIFSKTLIP